jgi:hypothetical protein
MRGAAAGNVDSNLGGRAWGRLDQSTRARQEVI